MSEERQHNDDSPVAGTSGTRRINYKRPRRLYSSSDSDEGDDEDTSYPLPSPKRVCTGKNFSDQRLDYLQKQVSELKYLITRNFQKNSEATNSADNVEGTLFYHEDNTSLSSALVEAPAHEFDWVEDTVTSESVKRTSAAKLDYLRKVQHLDSSEWNSVRYTDVQKKYVSSPGYTNLVLNDELLAFESKFNHLRSLDQTFGVLTNMLVAQKEALQKTLKDLLEWGSDDTQPLTNASLSLKVRELFSNTCPYMDISKDILQIVCGRRANVIEHRRDNAISAVRDKYNKAILRKIPPSVEYLFHPKEFSDAVAKLGGGAKIFYKSQVPAEGSHLRRANNRPYLPAEGNQAIPRRPTGPAVSFRGYNRNQFQQATASGKDKFLAGKRNYTATKNKSYPRQRDDYRDHRKQ